MRSWIGCVGLLLAACSSQPRTPAEEEFVVPTTSAALFDTVPGGAYVAFLTDPVSTAKQRAYFDVFPGDYASLRQAFGFEEVGEDSVDFGQYYEHGNDMIGAFFKLDSLPVKEVAAKAIGIARRGVWQADGVAYFQLFLARHVEKNPAVYLRTLATMPYSDQAGFWKFYMDGPEAYPAEDRSRLRDLLVQDPQQLRLVDSLLILPNAGH